jgi:outer membrane protein assembly factor BamB
MAHNNGIGIGRRLVLVAALAGGLTLVNLGERDARGGDWPQYRGPNRDARVTDFKPPKAWPKELKQSWKVTVGDGVATPALVGDKLYVFTREGNSEITRCLNAATGKEVWKESYDTEFKGKGDQDYKGPRSSPSVTDGKVITFGVNGTLSCLKAESGEKLWRVETGGRPTFHTSSSPLVVDEFVVAQVGSEGAGGVTAYDLATGKVRWEWKDEGASYASPVLMTVGDAKVVVAETSKSVVALGLAEGKAVWKAPFAVPEGRGKYNASTPLVDGQTVLFAGIDRGLTALKVEKKGNEFATKELWKNKDGGAQFNTPILKNGHVFGQAANNTLFCINAETGKTAWTESIDGGGRGGYGNIVDAGSVLMILTPNATLRVFEPSVKEYNELAKYKAGANFTYGFPVVTGNRIYIKDRDTLILYTVE